VGQEAKPHQEQISFVGLFEDSVAPQEQPKKEECIGCTKDNIKKHSGVYCKIKDWKAGRGKKSTLRYIDLIGPKTKAAKEAKAK
jgi:hypothetical protein